MAGAYGQTDVMNDPNWIIHNMAGRGPHDPIRVQMEAALKMIEMRQAENARQQTAQEGAQTRAQIAEENNRTRQSGIDTASADRAATLEMEQGKNNQLNASREELRKSQQLDTVTKLLATTTPGSPEYKQLSAHAMKLVGVEPTAAAPGAQDALKSAVQSGAIKVHGGQPQVGGTPPAATTPVSSGAPTTGTPPESGPFGAVDQGLGFARNGFPNLPNTPESAGFGGTINGRPAGDVIAEGALKRSDRVGFNSIPEAESGQTALAAIRANPALNTVQNPPPHEDMVANPVSFSPGALAAQPQTGVGAGELGTPPSTLGNVNVAGTKAPLPGPNPVPNATPAPGAPQPAFVGPLNIQPGAVPAPTPGRGLNPAELANKVKKPEDFVAQQ